MTPSLIGQIIGYVASFITLTIFFRKKRNDMIVLKLITDLLWMTHHILIGSYPAAATTIIAVGREIVFYITAKNGKMNNIYPVIFALMFASSAIITWKDAFSLLPAMASIAATAAFWNKNPQAIRIISLISSVFMLIYAIHYSSYPTILNEAVLEPIIIFTFILTHVRNSRAEGRRD